MVHVARDSTLVDEQQPLFARYREINKQLARENGELKQQLSHLLQMQANQTEEVLDLRLQVRRLTNKFDVIKSIILDNEIPSLAQLKSSLKDHPVTSNNNTTVTANGSDASSQTQQEEGEENVENQESANTSEEEDHASRRQLVSGGLDPILETASQHSNSSYSDSLDPSNVSSVPPFHQQEHHTPSVWHCLDSIEPNETLTQRDDFNQNNNSNNEPVVAPSTNANNQNDSRRQPTLSPRSPSMHNVSPINKPRAVNPVKSSLAVETPSPDLSSKITSTHPISSTPIKTKPAAGNNNRKKRANNDCNNNPDSAPHRYNLRKRAKK